MFTDTIRDTLVFLVIFFVLTYVTDSSADESYVYAEVTQGFAFQSSWIGEHPTSVQAGVHIPLTTNQYLRLELQHISNIGRGCNLQIGDECRWFVDDRDETWLNQGTVTYGIKFNL